MRLSYYAARILKSTIHNILEYLGSPRVIFMLGEPLFLLLGLRTKKRKFDFARVKRILVVRLDAIGDVVMTTSFLRELRRNIPHAWITLVVKPSVYNLVELCPYVNEVLTYDWYASLSRRHIRAAVFAWKYLWRRRFDLAILPRWDADYYNATLIAYLSGAPWRAGYSESVIANKKLSNRGFDRLLTHISEDNILKHEVQHNLDLLRFLGGTVDSERAELHLGEDDECFAQSVLKEYGVKQNELVVGFGPSGGDLISKRWPVSNFSELGRWLHKEYNARIIVVGAANEESLGSQIKNTFGPLVIDLVGKTTLRQLAALLGHCQLYVGNDSGPMHIAATMGIPTVALFGPSCYHRFAPWVTASRVIWSGLKCGPCFRNVHLAVCGTKCALAQPSCILGITVEQVKKEIISLFNAESISFSFQGK